MDFTSPHIRIKCQNCTCMSGAFHHLTPKQLAEIDQNRSEITYKKGEILCKQGAFISNMMFVKDGLVKVYLEGVRENPTVLSLESCGHFIGLPFILYEKGVYNYTVEALTDCEVCLVDADIFRKMIDENAAFDRELLNMLNEELIKSYHHTYSLTQKQIVGRFAELLLYLKDSIYHTSEFKLNISRRDMADLIATSQESISRLIKQFKNENLIDVKHLELKILDEAKLRYLSKVG